MSDSLGTELIHVTCGNCKNMTSFSLASLEQNGAPDCPYCGQPIPVNLQAAEKDARREAQELDQSVDALGSVE